MGGSGKFMPSRGRVMRRVIRGGFRGGGMLPLQVAGVNMEGLVKRRRIVAGHQEHLEEDDEEKGGDHSKTTGLRLASFMPPPQHPGASAEE